MEKTPNEVNSAIEEIRDDYDDDKSTSGGYHRQAAEPPALPTRLKAPKAQKTNKGVNLRPSLPTFSPEEIHHEGETLENQRRCIKIARLALESGIPDEYIEKYYMEPDTFLGYSATDPIGDVVAVEQDGEVIVPEHTEPDQE